MEKYEGWNTNTGLFDATKAALAKIYKNFGLEWQDETFKDFALTKECFLVKGDTGDNFVNKGIITFTKEIYYPEARQGENAKRWAKEKIALEGQFKLLFEKFQLPEQSYKANVNPLMGGLNQANLMMEDKKSKLFKFKELANIFNIQDIDTIFSDWLSFQFIINKQDTYLKNNCLSGINEIDGGQTAYIPIQVLVYIESPLDYCKYVINSDTLSEILYFNYLDQQLGAYLGYNQYPNPQINKVAVTKYFFNEEKSYKQWLVEFPTGNIYYIPKEQLTYNQYIDATRPLYNRDKQELVGELFDIEGIKNKMMGFDPITQHLIYTDSFGEIQELNLFGAEEISTYHLEGIRKKLFGSQIMKDFLVTLKGIYYRLGLPEYKDFDTIVGNIEDSYEIGYITQERFPEFFEILNLCYNHWDILNFDFVAKVKSKFMLSLLLGMTTLDKPLNNLHIQGVANLPHNKDIPLALNPLLEKTLSYNQLLQFPEAFRDEFFFNHISKLLVNREIQRPAIVTRDELTVYNRLAYMSDGKFNGLILNHQTFKDLYERMGEESLKYFRSLPTNTILIINPELFFDSSELGDTELYLANKLSFRSLMAEYLNNLGIDYLVYYKDKILDLKDLVPATLRYIYKDCKFRIIYGNIDYKDALILDPNSNLGNEESYNTLKTDIYFTKEEAIKNTLVFRMEDFKYLGALPKITESFYNVDIPQVQQDFYKELVNLGFNNLYNNKDYEEAILQSNLIDKNEITPYIANYLQQADIFLNAPNSDLFLFKEKFEGDMDNKNLISGKLDTLYCLLASQLFGGIVQGVRRKAKIGKVLVIAENREVRDHLYKYLAPKFQPNTCFKFMNMDQQELAVFNNEARIGFATKDMLEIGADIKDITTFIFPQNSWNMNFLKNNKNLVHNITANYDRVPDVPVEIAYVLYDKSLEVNKLQAAFNYYIENKINKNINELDEEIIRLGENLTYPNYITENVEVGEIPQLYKLDLFEKYNKLNTYFQKKADDYLGYLKTVMLEKNYIKLSDCQIKELLFGIPDAYNGEIGKECYIPYINNMYLNKFNLMPYMVDERFSDVNGNKVIYYNMKAFPHKTVLTEFGVGKIASEVKDKILVDIFNFKEMLVNQDTIYGIPYDGEEKAFEQYAEKLRTYPGGNCLLNPILLKPTTIKVKDEEEELDQADSSINLYIKMVDGLFSLYTMEVDADNIRLENYNFTKFSNIFLTKIANIDEMEALSRMFRQLQADPLYISAIQQAWRAFAKGEIFILPAQFNYFQDNQINQEHMKVYPIIWDKQFLVAFNGNFYQKQGYKVSRKFTVDLVKSLYIQQWRDLKDCRYELLKISKTLNILNLQEVMSYFEQTFAQRKLLNIIIPSNQDYQMKLSNEALQEIKDREHRLKEHIKKLRGEKNE